jgi:hypothetical protein
MNLKPINIHLVNGSTMMGFGIVAVYLGLDVISKSTLFEQTIGIPTIVGGIWFLCLGIYEMFLGSIKMFG